MCQIPTPDPNQQPKLATHPLLGEKPRISKPARKKAQKKCNYDHCTNNAKSRGLCKRHGGGMRCRVQGCTTSARPGGLCIAHGGGLCKIVGCVTGARSGGMCLMHQRVVALRNKRTLEEGGPPQPPLLIKEDYKNPKPIFRNPATARRKRVVMNEDVLRRLSENQNPNQELDLSRIEPLQFRPPEYQIRQQQHQYQPPPTYHHQQQHHATSPPDFDLPLFSNEMTSSWPTDQQSHHHHQSHQQNPYRRPTATATYTSMMDAASFATPATYDSPTYSFADLHNENLDASTSYAARLAHSKRLHIDSTATQGQYSPIKYPPALDKDKTTQVNRRRVMDLHV